MMKNLQLHDLDNIDNIVSPEHFEQLSLNSSAISIFTDFKTHKALVIEDDALAIDVLKLMLKAHVRMKVVISQSKEMLGIISTNELSEQNIIAEIGKGSERDEILVRDLMVPRKQLHAFDYSELENATVYDVILALKNYGLRHCLVLDREHHHIRGVISASDIARKLHLHIDVNTRGSFSQIYDEVYK
jgi:CBS domain containing-hemolysin-like protein